MKINIALLAIALASLTSQVVGSDGKVEITQATAEIYGVACLNKGMLSMAYNQNDYMQILIAAGNCLVIEPGMAVDTVDNSVINGVVEVVTSDGRRLFANAGTFGSEFSKKNNNDLTLITKLIRGCKSPDALIDNLSGNEIDVSECFDVPVGSEVIPVMTNSAKNATGIIFKGLPAWVNTTEYKDSSRLINAAKQSKL